MQNLQTLINDFSKEYVLETLHDIMIAYSCNVSEDSICANRTEHISFLQELYKCVKCCEE